MCRNVPWPRRHVKDVSDCLQKDEKQADNPQPDTLLQVPSPQKVEDGEQGGHGGQVRKKLDVHRSLSEAYVCCQYRSVQFFITGR